MKGAILSVLVVVALVQLMAVPGEAVDCGQVSSNLGPCIPFLTGAENVPSAACCGGVKNLTALATTTADSRAACNCMKAAGTRYPNIKEDAASSLPNKCGVQLNFPISKNTGCQKHMQ